MPGSSSRTLFQQRTEASVVVQSVLVCDRGQSSPTSPSPERTGLMTGSPGARRLQSADQPPSWTLAGKGPAPAPARRPRGRARRRPSPPHVEDVEPTPQLLAGAPQREHGAGDAASGAAIGTDSRRARRPRVATSTRGRPSATRSSWSGQRDQGGSGRSPRWTGWPGMGWLRLVGSSAAIGPPLADIGAGVLSGELIRHRRTHLCGMREPGASRGERLPRHRRHPARGGGVAAREGRAGGSCSYTVRFQGLSTVKPRPSQSPTRDRTRSPARRAIRSSSGARA